MAILFNYPKFQAFDDNGDPLVGGLLYSYIAGTDTPKATYTTRAMTTANANPAVLDSRGEKTIYGAGLYKFILKTSAAVAIWTQDNIELGPGQGANCFWVDPSETDQGAVGTGSSLKDILTALGTSEKGMVYLAHNGSGNTTTYTVSTTFDASSYVNVHFIIENGAQFSIGAGVTLTLPSTANVDAAVGQQIVGSTGSLRFAKGGAFHPGWWGAKGDATTDDSAAIQACIDSYKALMTTLTTASYQYDTWQGPTLEMIGGRIYLVNTSLNTGGTTQSCLKGWNGHGCTILGKTTGQPVIVNTGGHIWYWRDITVEGDGTSIPSCGVFLARDSGGDGAGGGYFTNFHIIGTFTYACLYNYVSEVNRFEGCWFWMESGHSAVMLLSDNTRSISPAVGSTVFSGTTTSMTQTFEDCEFYTNDSTAGVLTLHSAMEIDGFDCVRIRNCEFNTVYGAHTGVGTTCNRPQLRLKGTSKNMVDMVIEGNLFHNQYLRAIEVSDAFSLIDAVIRNNDWGVTPVATGNNTDNGSYQFYAAGAVDIFNCRIDVPNFYAVTAGTTIINSEINISGSLYRNAAGQHVFNMPYQFSGTLICNSTDSVTISTTQSQQNLIIHYSDSGLVVPHRGQYRNHNTTTIETATTADLHSYTLPAGIWKPFTSWLILAKGRFTGANGNKAIKLYIGAQTYTILPAANYAHLTQWVCKVHLLTTGAATQLGIGKTYTNEIGGTAVTYTWLDSEMLPAQNSAAAITVKWEGILSHGDDSINQMFSQISPY